MQVLVVPTDTRLFDACWVKKEAISSVSMFIYEHVPTIKFAQCVNKSNSGAQLGAIFAYHYLNCLPVKILPPSFFFAFSILEDTKSNGNILSYHKSHRILTFNICICTELTNNYEIKFKPVLFGEVPFDSITLHCSSCKFRERALCS